MSYEVGISNWDQFRRLVIAERKKLSLRQNSFKGISQAAISKIENDAIVCNFDMALQLAKQLGFKIVLKKNDEISITEFDSEGENGFRNLEFKDTKSSSLTLH